MSEQDDFYLEVERAVAEHRKMNILPEIPEGQLDREDRSQFLSALHALKSLPKEELDRRWDEVARKKKE